MHHRILHPHGVSREVALLQPSRAQKVGDVRVVFAVFPVGRAEEVREYEGRAVLLGGVGGIEIGGKSRERMEDAVELWWWGGMDEEGER